jgi:hypothetical protein
MLMYTSSDTQSTTLSESSILFSVFTGESSSLDV